MIKNILFVFGALLLITSLWWVYQLIGEWVFLIGITALFIVLISNIKQPKFGNKKNKNS